MVRRDRALVGTGLAGITVLAWLYLVRLESRMDSMEGMSMSSAMPMAMPWSTVEIALTFLMWAVMMTAMMIPAATSMILVFVTINRKRAESGTTPVPTGLFVLGYLIVWTGFSLVAALGQWALQSVALVSPDTLKAAPLLGGTLLVAAGVYEFTPLKHVCLSRCQSPLVFLMMEWREGRGGAFVTGLRHGVFCVGCCWALMTLLFVVGVMNLLWVALIAVFVLVEKLIPGRLVSYTAGVLLVAFGLWVIGRSL